MASLQLSTECQILMTGLAFGESPRWHEGRLWFCNWGTGEIVALDPDGSSEVMLTVPTSIPYSIDWLPDGRLLVVSGREGLVLRQEAVGSLETHFTTGPFLATHGTRSPLMLQQHLSQWRKHSAAARAAVRISEALNFDAH